jgi:hypothetical protein
MSKHIPIVILFGCAALFVFGLVQLFELRFATGDVYPAYSSLRADPLGTMAFYESLGKIPGLSVRRDFSDSDQLPTEPRTVYLQFAGSSYDLDWLPDDSVHEIEDFLARGNRLVIAFSPETGRFGQDGDESASGNGKSGKMATPKSHKKKNVLPGEDAYTSLADKWNFHVDFKKLASDGDSYSPVQVINATNLLLPGKLDWHSATVFTRWDQAWQPIYLRGKDAVVMERHFAHGSVVLATDSYFASNEAMEKDRHADLLAWLIGPDSHVVFDESHFGIVDTGGVATLMRQYRLQGLMAGFILLAGLFIWKNSTSLVPPPEDEEEQRFVTGKDSASGFVNLLRRSIAPRDLLAACFTAWKKSGAAGRFSTARFQQAEAVFNSENAAAGKDRQPVSAYVNISKILGSQKQKL